MALKNRPKSNLGVSVFMFSHGAFMLRVYCMALGRARDPEVKGVGCCVQGPAGWKGGFSEGVGVV